MFRVGDKVKRIKWFDMGRHNFSRNEEYTVTKVTDTHIWLNETLPGGWVIENFILAKPKGPYLSNQGDPINV